MADTTQHDEKYVQYALERLIWIELAKRKEYKENPDVYAGLRNLHGKLKRFFSDNWLVPNEPFENAADLFFDEIQFGGGVEPPAQMEIDFGLDTRDENGPLTNESYAASEQVRLLCDALDRFGDETRRILCGLSYCEGFRLADFSACTNLVDLYRWWSYITSGVGQKEMNSNGGFSNIGKKSPSCESGGTRVGCAIPIRVPEIVANSQYNGSKADSVFQFFAGDCTVSIDGCMVHNGVVLIIDSLKPSPVTESETAQIETALITKSEMLQIETALQHEYADQLYKRYRSSIISDVSGISQVPDDSRVISFMDPRKLDSPNLTAHYNKISDTKPVQLPSGKCQLVKAPKNVRPLILGLLGWGFANVKGMSNENALRQVVKVICGANTGNDNLIKNSRYGFKRISEEVESYDPSKLPWLSEQAEDTT